MDIRELQEKLRGVYDLTDTVDCQSVISMLLKEVEAEKESAVLHVKEANQLAELVAADSPEAKQLAERMNEQVNKIQQKARAWDFIQRMCKSMDSAEKLPDTALIDEVLQSIGNLSMDSYESAVIEELVHRFKNPKGKKNDGVSGVPKID